MNSDYLVLIVNISVFLLILFSQRKLIEMYFQARNQGVSLPVPELYMMMNKDKIDASVFVPYFVSIKKSGARIRLEDLKKVYQAGGDLKFFEGGIIYAHQQSLFLDLDLAVNVACQKRNLLLEIQDWQRNNPKTEEINLE